MVLMDMPPGSTRQGEQGTVAWPTLTSDGMCHPFRGSWGQPTYPPLIFVFVFVPQCAPGTVLMNHSWLGRGWDAGLEPSWPCASTPSLLY